MKKLAKRLALDTHTLRPLTGSDLSHVQGGTISGTSVISVSGPSVIRPTTGQSGPSVIHPTTGQSGPSVIVPGGG